MLRFWNSLHTTIVLTFGFAVLTQCFVLNLSLAFDEKDVESVQAYNFYLLLVFERKRTHFSVDEKFAVANHSVLDLASPLSGILWLHMWLKHCIQINVLSSLIVTTNTVWAVCRNTPPQILIYSQNGKKVTHSFGSLLFLTKELLEKLWKVAG